MDMIIAAIIIVVLAMVFVFAMFKSIVKRVNQNAKLFFISRLEDYEDIIKEKESQIIELNKDIQELKENKEKLESHKTLPYLHTREKKEEEMISTNIKTPPYREDNFFFNYKELKNQFNFDKETLIKEFIKEHCDKKDEKKYKILSNFKKKFDKNAIYQLITLPGEEQIEILDKILTEKEKELIDINNIVEDKSKFSIALLLDKIDEMMIIVDPIMRIYVSKYDKSYDYIDPYIRTEKYALMSEGIIIEYKGKSYDYSI